MDAYPREHFIIFSLGIALVGTHLTFSISSIVNSSKIHTLIANLREFCLTFARHSSSADEQIDSVGEEVLRLMCERRKQRMNTCCSLVCHAAAIVAVAAIYNIWNQSPRWFSFEQDAVFMLFFGVGLAFNVMNCKGHATALCFYSVIMAFITLFVVFGAHWRTASAEVVLYTGVSSFAIRMVATMNVLHLRVAVFWNVVSSFSICCKSILFEPEGTVGTYPSSNFVLFEAAQSLTVILLAEATRASNWAEVYHSVKAAAGSIEKSAVKGVLDSICDAILPLDSDLAITEDVPRFKGMLMLNPGSVITGQKLDTYVPCNEDKMRLRHLLTSSNPSSTDAAVRCFNVGIRDSDGNIINVEMFGLAFEALNRSIHYMLGIRELSEAQARPAPLRQSREVHRRGPSSARERLQVRASVIGSPTEVSSSLSASSASTPPSSALARARQRHDLRETSDMAKISTLLNLLRSWNFSSPLRSCCTMHAGLPEVKRMLKRVRGLPCMTNLHSANVEQCTACGVLKCFDNDVTCRVCGHEERLRL